MLAGLSPARRRFLISIALALAAVVGVAVALAGSRSDVQPAAQDDLGPVLLVAGYGGRTSTLEPVRAALELEGREAVVVEPLDGGTGDLDDQAVALDRAARAALERYDAGSVDVVGYSAGGVVARLWIRDHGGASLARRVLTVGSPQHGTTVAELALAVAGSCPDACRQLVPGSDLLRGLNARDETPAGPQFVSVWSETDRTVTPPATARLEGALNLTVQSVCPGARTSHLELPGDPVVQALLTSALGVPAPRAPADVSC